MLEKTEVPAILPAKSIYKCLLELPVEEFITTNYDYAIEKVLESTFVPRYVTRERLYSRYRTQSAGGKTVTHIHGECAYPESICLGFEQYAGTLEKIRSMLTTSTEVKA